jgi:lipopolysaccharide export system protein LptC
MKLKLGAFLVAALYGVFLPLSVIAASPQASLGFGGWQINTGEVDTNWQTGAFSAPVPVLLTRPGSKIQASRATGNFKSKQAVLSGNVRVYDQSGTLTNFASNRKPSSLTCDSLQVDGISKIYVATGSVHFTQGSSWANADRAVMNGNTHDLHLYGHVSLHQ